MVKEAYKYVLESVKEKKIDRTTAIQLIKLLEDETPENDDIAIIGMAAKLPTIESIEEYWKVIECGLDCITDFPESRSRDIYSFLREKGMHDEEIRFGRGSYLRDIDKFDYKFFKLSPREASLMDPCQRIFLELCWQAIENAGYGGSKLEGTNTGVYVGYAGNLRDMYGRLVEGIDPEGLSIGMVGNLTAVIPSRISYLLDLKGPSMVIDTACSSSLVSIYTACQALNTQECDYAIAGGININTMPLDKEHMKTGIESSDGISRSFDNYSDGSGVGEGLGVVLLKSLKKAVEDKDHIYAVIKGSAINQDGRSAGITAPSPQAQRDVITKAWEHAGINPETIAYIETHGTGTNLGDPIEIQGIHSAFQRYTNKKQFCAVSSVKTNIGHLSESAGIVSVVKAILSLNAKQIPPSIYFNRPNRSIPFEDSSVYVNTKLRPWPTAEYPRRCGVSGFGISGTNCHIVLEEAPSRVASEMKATYPNIFAISAKSEEALYAMVSEFINYLERHDDKNLQLEEICYTANSGRGHYSHRLYVLPENLADLRTKLQGFQLSKDEQAVSYSYHRLVDSNKGSQNPWDISERERENLTNEVRPIILDFQREKDKNARQNSLLKMIGDLYLRGADVHWESLAGEEKPYKVPLPSYPFERIRCWVEPVGVKEQSASSKDSKDLTDLYSMNWIEEPLTVNGPPADLNEILVIKDQLPSSFVDSLVSTLRAKGIKVIEVILGQPFAQIDDESFQIMHQAEDYQKLATLLNKHFNISHILHMSALGAQEVNTLAELTESQDKGVYSLFHLAQSFLKENSNINASLIIFTLNLYSVSGQEPAIYPEFSTLSGLGKVIAQEYSHIHCKAIDIDEYTSADSVLPELTNVDKQYQSAYRKSQRFVEEFGPFTPSKHQAAGFDVKPDGVYLITGGTGGIGLETAKLLASKNHANIALINRSAFPDRKEWESILQKGDQKSLIDKLKIIHEMESMGSKITIIQADVSDITVMTKVIHKLRSEYGRINGVFHGAGVAGAGYLYNKEIKIFESVLKPKVIGTWILDRLTREDELDFFVMQSSGVSLVGEAGQGDYVSGNSYLDSFAAYRRKNTHHALSVNWVSWKETGMSVQYGINVDSIFKAIPTKQAIWGLERALSHDLSNVLIGEINESPEYASLFQVLPFKLSRELDESVGKNMPGGEDEVSIISNGSYDAAIVNKGKLIILPKGSNPTRKSIVSSNVSLKGKQEGDYSELEAQLADVYCNILGYDEINIHDNFFELGGDSMLLSKVHASLDKLYPGKLRLQDLFEYTSIHKLCRFLTQGVVESDSAQMTSEFNDLSMVEEETQRMFDDLERGGLSVEEATKKFMSGYYD